MASQLDIRQKAKVEKWWWWDAQLTCGTKESV